MLVRPRDPRLARLADQLRALQQRGRGEPPRIPSGLPVLDFAVGGGFVTGALHEFVAPDEGVAAYSLALELARRAAGRHKWIICIDPQQELYPPALAQRDVPLERVLVVRSSRVADALWVCEQTLRCRAIAAVLLPLRRLEAHTSRRLQLAAEAGGSLGLLLRTAPDTAPTFAASRLGLAPALDPQGRRQLRITVLKLRDGRPGEPFVVDWPDATGVVSAHAVSRDRAGAPRRAVGG